MAFFEGEWRSPILVSDLAAALLELTALDITGILHVAGAEPLNRYELACMIAAARTACRPSACVAGPSPSPASSERPTVSSTRAGPAPAEHAATRGAG